METDQLTETDWPTTEGATDALAETLVSARCTLWFLLSEEALYPASPANDTLRLRLPAEGKLRAQLPAEAGAEQEAPWPSLTVTEPEGVPAPGATTATDQLTTTG